MQIVPLGDSALLIRVAQNLQEEPELTLKKLIQAKASIEAAAIPGIVELAPAYTSIAVFYDMISVIDAGASADGVVGWLEERIRTAIEIRASAGELHTRVVDIPVCYQEEFALDIEEVAKHARLSRDDIVDLHSRAEYRVQCVGFTPGFPYLSGLPKQIATPRKQAPRTEIPAGSVGIGGSQSGIYPTKSPGGWNIIGRTPMRLFDPKKNPPAFLRIGDRVRFRIIPRQEFERLRIESMGLEEDRSAVESSARSGESESA
jgi:inhibitor of KinA